MSSAAETALVRALDLSWRISKHSPPMKPFIRFAQETQHLYGDDQRRTRSFFWDFDAMIQKVILGIVRANSTPETLAAACIKRWSVNLAELEAGSRRSLQDIVASGRPVRLRSRPRLEYIVGQMRPRARFLFAGCGAGAECLLLASRGLEVVGIDTVPGLVDVANAWARQLGLPFKAICLDAMALDSGLGSFDGFLVEFYGDQTSWNRTLLLQQRLHGVLSDDGKGFVIATRRKYASYWYLGMTDYSALMTNRLAVQARFDCRFSQPDKSEEQLRYGLYTRTHTRDSLAAELNHSFRVLECTYDKSDPRYVMCVVGRGPGTTEERERGESQDIAEAAGLRISGTSISGLLDKVETICEMLETHEKQVQQFYDKSETAEALSPIKAIEVDYAAFIGLLEEVSAVLPDSEE